ncbi:DUF7144 family membrane protein [Actinomadura gamaensis]|uniref:DUF7144 domain-containing protein n=1 Tax=Actinomadura gamaensis TaxID=1763541 RepID=A0ABV9U120_9ACTN
MATERHGKESFALGMAVFAGIMMMLVGILHAVAGFAAILRNEFYVATPHYLFTWDATAWGWVHLIAGIVVAAAAFGVLGGLTWARVVGMVTAGLSAFVNFLDIPNYPVWSVLIIALDAVVIWALAVYMNPYKD